MIQVSSLTKVYKNDGAETIALNGVSFKVDRGEFVAIIGPSGSGKSTLMHILGALDTPTAGSYTLDGVEISQLDDTQLAKIRNQKIGFVFQAYNLLPRTSALKNVSLPMVYAGIPKDQREIAAKKFLTMVGLGDRMNNMPNQLSGGQQQRVAIARSLVMNPSVLLADEPTGNLATAQSKEIMAIFRKLNATGHTILMITHEPEIAKYSKRIILLRDGKIVEDKSNRQSRGK